MKRLACTLAAAALLGACGGGDHPTAGDLEKAARSCAEHREMMATIARTEDAVEIYGVDLMVRGQVLLDRCERAGL